MGFLFFGKKRKEARDKKQFDEQIEKFEKLNFKKCRQCGENVPKEDNICPSCNQIP